jgi:hypothetical protein
MVARRISSPPVTAVTLDGPLVPVVTTEAAVMDPRHILIPDGTTIDGAVAELTEHPDGTITADIRINGPAVP